VYLTDTQARINRHRRRPGQPQLHHSRRRLIECTSRPRSPIWRKSWGRRWLAYDVWSRRFNERWPTLWWRRATCRLESTAAPVSCQWWSLAWWGLYLRTQ